MNQTSDYRDGNFPSCSRCLHCVDNIGERDDYSQCEVKGIEWHYSDYNEMLELFTYTCSEWQERGNE